MISSSMAVTAERIEDTKSPEMRVLRGNRPLDPRIAAEMYELHELRSLRGTGAEMTRHESRITTLECKLEGFFTVEGRFIPPLRILR